jgi:hypothetical protein
MNPSDVENIRGAVLALVVAALLLRLGWRYL